MGGTYCTQWRDEKFNTFIRKPKGKKPCGRSRHRWEDNVIMGLREMG